jgi:hypothetical protein
MATLQRERSLVNISIRVHEGKAKREGGEKRGKRGKEQDERVALHT